ncbi:MAG: STAS domain-containing protein [Leptolyngbyaceae cyanobacterium]
MIYQSDNFVLLRPQGRLDASNALDLQHHIKRLPVSQGSLWVIDLDQVSFVDSAGLVALITGFKLAQRHQCRLMICNLCPAVRLIFEITQLDEIFEVFNSHLDVIATCNLTPDAFPADASWAA